jgi:hypothetical protein
LVHEFDPFRLLNPKQLISASHRDEQRKGRARGEMKVAIFVFFLKGGGASSSEGAVNELKFSLNMILPSLEEKNKITHCYNIQLWVIKIKGDFFHFFFS